MNTRIFSEFQLPTISSYYTLVVALIGPSTTKFLLVIIAVTWYRLLKTLVFRLCIPSIQVRSQDPLYNDIMEWISEQQFMKFANSLTAASKHSPFFQHTSLEEEKEPMSIKFTPAPGWHIFWYNNKPLIIRRLRVGKDSWVPQEIIQFYAMGTSVGILKKIIDKATTASQNRNCGKTCIYRPINEKSFNWRLVGRKASRSLETIFLSDSLKNEILDDIRRFLGNHSWYSNRAISYKRGYLFHGPPGTGKSSMCLAIAGEFGLGIYMLGLANKSLTDEGLAVFFENLPDKCMVLLEDIDRVHVAQGIVTDGPQSGISISGLLNALDGVASHGGHILILTSNNPEKLDKALVRKGRVDKSFHFPYAEDKVLIDMFRRMFDSTQQQASEFAQLLPSGAVTTADVQEYLMQYDNCKAAVDGAEAWVQSMKKGN